MVNESEISIIRPRENSIREMMLTTLICYPTEDPFYIFGAESQRFSG